MLENLSISEQSLSVLEKIQHNLVLPNIKYNCAVLFLDKCIGYLFLLLNIFSVRPPL